MSENEPSLAPAKRRSWLPSLEFTLVVLGAVAVFFGLALGPIGGHPRSRQSSSLQAAHALGLAMYSYAQDNNGNYPDGKSSTEVFQQLLDGGYVTDASIFYIHAHGKTPPVPGQKLKPENVCWDVTGGLTTHSPGGLPLLFMTGYRASYTPGSAAIPVANATVMASRTWSQWWNGEPDTSSIFVKGVAAFYVDNSVRWMNRTTAPDGTSPIPNFVSPDYVPEGKTYRQLTPDGVLPP